MVRTHTPTTPLPSSSPLRPRTCPNLHLTPPTQLPSSSPPRPLACPNMYLTQPLNCPAAHPPTTHLPKHASPPNHSIAQQLPPSTMHLPKHASHPTTQLPSSSLPHHSLAQTCISPQPLNCPAAHPLDHSLAQQRRPLDVHIIKAVVHGLRALPDQIDDHVGSADGVAYHFLVANLEVFEHHNLHVCVCVCVCTISSLPTWKSLSITTCTCVCVSINLHWSRDSPRRSKTSAVRGDVINSTSKTARCQRSFSSLHNSRGYPLQVDPMNPTSNVYPDVTP